MVAISVIRPRECNLGPADPQVRYQRVAVDDAGMRLDNYLLRELKGVPRSHVYRIIRSGEVRINKGRARPNSRLAADDHVRIPPVRVSAGPGPGRPPDDLIERVESSVLRQTGAFIALDKPAGLAVHAGSGVRFGVIEVLRAARPDESLELVHRLDRDTSGCLLVARSRRALARLRAALREPATQKRYLALLCGRWRGGEREVDAALIRDREIGGERLSAVDAAGKTALSRFVPRELFADSSLMEVAIATGRTHQIRVHAAHLGFPVAGDRKYGDKAHNRSLREAGLDRMFLHAWQVVLPGSGMQAPEMIEAPVPADLQAVLERLREAA